MTCPKCATAISVPVPAVAPVPPQRPESDGNTGASSPPADPLGTPAPGTPKLRFDCPKCGKAYKAGITNSGKRTKCKACGHIFHIPGTPRPESRHPSPQPSAGDIELEEVEESTGPVAVPPPRPPQSRSVPALPPASQTSTPTPAAVPTALPPGGRLPVLPRPLWRDPVKLAFAVAGFGLFWFFLFALLLVIALAKESTHAVLIVLIAVSFVAATVSGHLTVQLFAAKQRAIAGKPVTLFFGLGRLLTWEQNEGLILLRDKAIAELIYGPKSGGGLRIIYPVLGEELRAQVPLTLQLTWFRDERVLTRESIQLVVKVAIWWQVADLEAYFYRIDQEVHSLNDRNVPGAGVATAARPTPRGRLGIAEVWVETLAETCLRKLISDTSTFLIVSKRASSHLHVETDHTPRPGVRPDVADLTPATPDVIADQLKDQLGPRLKAYGLMIDRVEIQEVQLPPAIQKAVDEVWVASTLPTKSGHEAQAQRNRLQVLCDLLGPQAAAMSEIVGKLPEGAYMGNPLAALQSLFAQLGGMGAPAVPPGGATMLPAPVPPPVPWSGP